MPWVDNMFSVVGTCRQHALSRTDDETPPHEPFIGCETSMKPSYKIQRTSLRGGSSLHLMCACALRVCLHANDISGLSCISSIMQQVSVELSLYDPTPLEAPSANN